MEKRFDNAPIADAKADAISTGFRPIPVCRVPFRFTSPAVITILVAILTMFGRPDRVGAQDLESIGSTPPVKVNGSISLRGAFYGTDRDSAVGRQDQPLSGIITGSVGVDLYGLQLPFSFSYSTDDHSFSQPFNQFGVSPHYKWATAHLGYRNLNYSPWTLSGHQIFGAGFELSPGPLRASFIAGRFRRAVIADTLDTLASRTPEFERTGFAGLLGYRGEIFQIELSGLKAADDTSGVNGAEVLATGTRPAENLVGGFSVGFRPVEGLHFSVNGGLSGYTRDTRSDSIDISGTPVVGEIQQPRASTQVYTGLKAEGSFQKGNLSLRADYTRIDPDFQSMGAYYAASDVEAISFSPTIDLANRKLRLSADLLWSHDNVAGKKVATTRTIGPSLNIDWTPSRAFGLSVYGSNRYLSQAAGTLPIDPATEMNFQTPSISILPRYSIIDTATVHAFSLVTTHQRMIDGNSVTADQSEYASTTASLSYNMTRIRSGLSLNASTTLTTLGNSVGTQEFVGASVGGSYPIVRDALTLDGNLSGAFAENSNTLGSNLGLSWRGGKHHTVNLTISLSRSAIDREGSNDDETFTQYRGVAGYAYRF